MDENSTTWKKKRFRRSHINADAESNGKDTANTFDKVHAFFEKSEKMINETEMVFDQLSKIQDKKKKEGKKRETRAKRTNYKNVKVLDNIYENVENEKEGTSTVEPFREGVIDSTTVFLEQKNTSGDYVNKPRKSSKKKYNLTGSASGANPLFPKLACGNNPFTKLNFNPNRPEQSIDLINKRVDYIMCILKYIVEVTIFFFTYVAVYIYTLADPTSKTKDADIRLVKQHVNVFFSLPIAIFIAYNWFLLMFYKDESLERLDREAEFNVFVNLNVPTSAVSIFNFLFYYLTRPLYVFDKFLFGLIPTSILSLKNIMQDDFPIIKYISNPLSLLLNPIFLFVTLCAVITVILAKHSGYYFNLLNQYLRMNTGQNMGPPFTGIYMGIMGLFILLALFPTTILEQVNLAKKFIFWFGTFWELLFKLIFILAFKQLCGVFIMFYLIFASLFSFTFFNKNITDVKDYLDKSINDIGKEDCPDNLNYWQKIIKFICIILSNSLYPYHEMVYIMFFIVGMFIYLRRMGSYKGKITFVLIHLLFIYTFSLVLYHMKLKRLFGNS